MLMSENSMGTDLTRL